MEKEELIKLCQKEFETADVVYESENRVIVDGKFRITYQGNGYLDIEHLFPASRG